MELIQKGKYKHCRARPAIQALVLTYAALLNENRPGTKGHQDAINEISDDHYVQDNYEEIIDYIAQTNSIQHWQRAALKVACKRAKKKRSARLKLERLASEAEYMTNDRYGVF